VQWNFVTALSIYCTKYTTWNEKNIILLSDFVELKIKIYFPVICRL